jgi:RimJ/RimL family protein N-acetyltransferase
MSASSVELRLLTGERSEMEALQEVLEDSSDFLYRITGHPPGQADAQSTYSILPEGKSYDDKFVYGIYQGDQMVGCADVIRGYPKEDTTLLAVLLVRESYQGKGIGTVAYGLLEDAIKSWEGVRFIQVQMVRTNEQALPFLRRLGFRETGEVKPYRYDKLVSEVIILEKELK